MERISNPDVPMEAAFKWTLRENKDLRRKLDMLVPYAKSLEQERDNLRRELAKQKEKCCALAKTAERNAAELPIKLKTLRKAIGHLKQGINMLESGKYADLVEVADQQIIDEI